jgi:hypothetical protein
MSMMNTAMDGLDDDRLAMDWGTGHLHMDMHQTGNMCHYANCAVHLAYNNKTWVLRLGFLFKIWV